MNSSLKDIFTTVFPTCRKILGDIAWGRIIETLGNHPAPHLFVDKLQTISDTLALPRYISDLARIESARHKAGNGSVPVPPSENITSLTVNPTLSLVQVSHNNLVPMITENRYQAADPVPSPEKINIIVWRSPITGEVLLQEAEDADLLALKIVVENILPKDAAAYGGVSVGNIDAILFRAISRCILLSPESLIKRDNFGKSSPPQNLEKFISADTFTLQWHITQTCDLRCKHCYDRSDRPPLPYEKAVAIIDDFYDFCQAMHVRGQITFTGGNPLLYPEFTTIYREASDRGFGIAILGNPSPIHQIDELIKIVQPLFFQVSLEGLESHNDQIRGTGHFQRTLDFLDQLRDREIFAMVMLTLTRDNMNEVLPLAEILRDRTDFFTFNRLSTVGEGARLLMADPEEFRIFLGEYEKSAEENPILGLKDNLINILRHHDQKELFGGCTGYGCGAAFNFLALLPDGEVHACRKFPSFLGNIQEQRLMDIYRSEQSSRYRKGSSGCSTCNLNAVCRGCLAVAYSHGLNVFQDRDPFCFMDLQDTPLPNFQRQ